jgi:hypothetical protein
LLAIKELKELSGLLVIGATTFARTATAGFSTSKQRHGCRRCAVSAGALQTLRIGLFNPGRSF